MFILESSNGALLAKAHFVRTGDTRAGRSEGLLSGAVSTGRCNTGFKFLCWCVVLQGLSWSFVELACDSAEFGLAEARYISAFGKVLPEKGVGIFVTAPLPWSLRITESHLGLKYS